MPEPKRTVEVRLLVVVIVNFADTGLIEALSVTPQRTSSVSEVVAAEVLSNLESVTYVESVIVSRL